MVRSSFTSHDSFTANVTSPLTGLIAPTKMLSQGTARQPHPLLLTFPPDPGPAPPPSLLCSLPLVPAVFPAIQAAISKFCNGFCVFAPPLNILFFCCSSNSFRISGSTAIHSNLVPVTDRNGELAREKLGGETRTAIHKVWHPNHKRQPHNRDKDHWVLEET